ncbi:MAG: TatD family hydrolase [Haloferacaceae archaeon]
MAHDGPTARPIGAAPESGDPPEPFDLRWIDPHQHTQSLTWNDREKFDLSGCRATVMIAAGYYWAPYRPVAASDVRFLWDDALRRARAFDHRHGYAQRVAVGVHTWSKVDDADELLAAMPAYLDDDRVVAVGETGLEATHHTEAWPLDEQRAVVREQFRLAAEAGLPALVHTPGSSKGGLDPRDTHAYEEGDRNFTAPLFGDGSAGTKTEAVEADLELAEEAGLPEEQVVVDHADGSVVDRVLGETDCWLSFSVGASWLRGVDARDVAAAVEGYGADRVLVDSDLIGAMRTDPFVIPRTAMDLLRLGLSREQVEQVLYENPKTVLGLDV